MGYFTEEKVISDDNRARERLKMLNNLALVGQFGLSLMMPVIMCVFVCYFLCSKGIAGEWVYIPGFILGLGASFMTAYKFYIYAVNKQDGGKKKVRRKGVYFNRHI